MDIQGANLFFQLIARRYEKVSTIFTSNKARSQWNEIFADMTIAAAILDRIMHHCTVINIKGESNRQRGKFISKNNFEAIADKLPLGGEWHRQEIISLSSKGKFDRMVSDGEIIHVKGKRGYYKRKQD